MTFYETKEERNGGEFCKSKEEGSKPSCFTLARVILKSAEDINKEFAQKEVPVDSQEFIDLELLANMIVKFHGRLVVKGKGKPKDPS